jgi:hypothetical protein
MAGGTQCSKALHFMAKAKEIGKEGQYPRIPVHDTSPITWRPPTKLCLLKEYFPTVPSWGLSL